MNWRCRWFGHKRRPLDGDGNGVSIRNIDACDRCGVLLRARGARNFSYVDKSPRIDLGADRRAALDDLRREVGHRMFYGD